MGLLGLFDCFRRRNKRKGPAGAADTATRPSAYEVLPSAAPSPTSPAPGSLQPVYSEAALPADHDLLSANEAPLLQQPPAGDADRNDELVTISSIAVQWGTVPSPGTTASAATPHRAPQHTCSVVPTQQAVDGRLLTPPMLRLKQGTAAEGGDAAGDKENAPAAADGQQRLSPPGFPHTPSLKSAVTAHETLTPPQQAASASTASTRTAAVRPAGPAAMAPSPLQQRTAPSPVQALALASPAPAASATSRSPLCGTTPAASQDSCATSQLTRFPFLVADTPSGQHTPQVAGVDNKVARYREDRQLAQRLTPFAERVEREMNAEERFRKRLSGSRRSDVA